MNRSLESLVRVVVARHLDVAPSSITLDQRTHEDLELDPLDLVLVALRLEEIKGIEFPIARLAHVATVKDLVDVTDTACEEQRSVRSPVLQAWRAATRGSRRRAAVGAVLLAFGGTARVARAEEPTRSPAAEATLHDDGDQDPSEDFRIGAFGGVAFPRPLALEGMVKVKKVLGLGLEYSALPAMTISGVDTSFWALQGDVRVFPMGDGFFVGVAAGRQHAAAQTTLSAASLGSVTEQVTADTWLVNPRIGFLQTWRSGLTLGIDAGVQIPVAATTTSTVPSSLPAGQEAMNVASLVGKTVLPTVDLLRLGLML